MLNRDHFQEKKLSLNDLELIDATSFSSLDKHYLRLLAHCLSCFHSIALGAQSGPLPDHELRLQWCMEQPSLISEKSFIPIFLKQLEVAGHCLEALALTEGVTPLSLQTEDLIKAMSSKALKNSPSD